MADQLMLGLDVPGAKVHTEGRGRAADESARQMAENAYLATWCDKMALCYPDRRDTWLQRAAEYRRATLKRKAG